MTVVRRLLAGVRGAQSDDGERRSTESLAAMLAAERGGPIYSGEPVTNMTALRLVAVYSSVRLIADAIASMPVHAYRPGQRSAHPISMQGGRVALNPQPRILTDPWPEISVYDWSFQMVSTVLLTGTAAALVADRDRRGVPTMAMPVHPDDLSYRRERGRIRWKVRGENVASDDLIIVRGFSVPGEPLGLSPIQQARQAIGIGLAAERFGGTWFGDQSAPSAVFEADAQVDEDDALETLARWEASHGGRRTPAMLTGGLKYRTITITPDESQFLETQRFTIGQIARLYGVPPHMIGDVDKSTSWGTGIEQQAIGFVTYTLRPWLHRFEEALSAVLPAGTYVRFNVDGLLRGDTKTRVDAYVKARQGGWLNVNEIRALEDMPPIGPAGDEYVQPLNLGPLGTTPPTDDDDPPTSGDDEP